VEKLDGLATRGAKQPIVPSAGSLERCRAEMVLTQSGYPSVSLFTRRERTSEWRWHAMKLFAIALALSVALAGPTVAAPGDPRLIQGTLEWPPTLSGGELFVVLRGDDGRTYYADVMAAQRHVQGPLTAGSRMTLLGLEGTKSHEIIAVALGSGDAAALSVTLSLATPTTPSTATPTPSTTPAGVALAASTPAAVPPARLEEERPTRGEEGRGVTHRGSVLRVAGQTLFLKTDDGQVVVDLSELDPGIGPRLRPGSPVTLVVVPVGDKLEARGFIETGSGTSGSAPAKVPRQPPVQREVVYPHGKYVLYGDGVNQAYQWVWIPTAPPGSLPTPPP